VTRATMIAGVLALAACSGASRQAKAPAAPASTQGNAAADQEEKDKSKLVCTWEYTTGSNIPEKVCRAPGDGQGGG
jgi:hypothetical protein